MKIINVYAFLAIMVASVTLADASNAATVQFTLDAIDNHNDTFDFNTVNFEFTNIDLNASGPNTYNETLTTLVMSQSDQSFIAGNTADSSRIFLFFGTPLASYPADEDLLDGLGPSAYAGRTGICGGVPPCNLVLTGDLIGTTVASTPLPSTFPLLAAGLGTLGLILLRRKRTEAAVFGV